MISLCTDFSNARTEHEQTVIERQLASQDCEIDKMVHDLYSLDEADKETVDCAVVSSKTS